MQLTHNTRLVNNTQLANLCLYYAVKKHPMLAELGINGINITWKYSVDCTLHS